MREIQLKFALIMLVFLAVVAGRSYDPRNEITSAEFVRFVPKENTVTTVTGAPIRPVADLAPTAALTAHVYPDFPRRKNSAPEPSLAVVAAVAKDLDSRFDLYRFESGRVWPYASLTKLMSAVVAREEVGFERRAYVSEEAVATEGVAGELRVGEVYRVGELVKAMMVVSSNDAAAAVAELVGKEAFVAAMNEKAISLGMRESSFVDASGLSRFNRGSAEDLEILAEYVYRAHPSIFKISGQKEVYTFEESTGAEKRLVNINHFVHSRPEHAGGKTGFTDEARGNLISIFSYKGRNILIIVLGTDDRFGQTDVLYNWIKEAYAF